MAEDDPIILYNEESESEIAQKRESIRKGKAIRGGPEVDEIIETSSSEGDDNIDEFEEEEGTITITNNDALKALKSIKITGTRYPHRETMVKLGIVKDVDLLLNACGLTQFVSNARGTHAPETIQFLSSVELRVYPASEVRLKSKGGFGVLTFEINSKKYHLTANQFEELFELPPCNGLDVEFERDELAFLWKVIADCSPYDPSKSKCTQIRNPAIRYFHRIIANTCFARHECGNVRRPEHEMIAEGLKNVLNRSGDYGGTFNGNLNNNGFTRVLMKQLTSYKKWACSLQNPQKAFVCIGGTVTRILEYCGVKCKSKPTPPGWLDMTYLRKHKFLQSGPQKGLWIYKFTLPSSGAEAKIMLPNVNFTALGGTGNIAFLPPDEFLIGHQVHMDRQEPEQESSDLEGEEPECYYFQEYVDPKMPKGLKVAHKHLSLLQKMGKWNVKKLNQVMDKLNSLTLGSSSGKAKNATLIEYSEPTLPDFRGPTPTPFMRSTSVSRHTRRRPTPEQPRRASSHVSRPMPQPQEQESTPEQFHFDLNSTLQLEPALESGGADYDYVAERTPELQYEAYPDPPTHRSSSSRTRRRRSTSAQTQPEEPDVQSHGLTLQQGTTNYMDQLGSYHFSTLPVDQQQQPPYDDTMDVDPAGWSLFR